MLIYTLVQITRISDLIYMKTNFKIYFFLIAGYVGFICVGGDLGFRMNGEKPKVISVLREVINCAINS